MSLGRGIILFSSNFGIINIGSLEEFQLWKYLPENSLDSLLKKILPKELATSSTLVLDQLAG